LAGCGTANRMQSATRLDMRNSSATHIRRMIKNAIFF
jgi:hypothetical protein